MLVNETMTQILNQLQALQHLQQRWGYAKRTTVCGGVRRAADLRVDAIHGEELAHVRHQHCALHYVLEAGAARLQDGAQLHKGCVRLLLDATRQLLRLRFTRTIIRGSPIML